MTSLGDWANGVYWALFTIKWNQKQILHLYNEICNNNNYCYYHHYCYYYYHHYYVKSSLGYQK